MLKQVEIDASKIQRVKTSRKLEAKLEIVIEIIQSEKSDELKRRYSVNEFNWKPNIGETKRKSEKIKFKKIFLDSSPHRQPAE